VGGYGTGFGGHLHSMFLPALTVAIALCAGGHPQPAGQHAQRARRRLHHHGQVQGRARPRLFVRHVLRNAVIPAVTVLGINIGFLIGGTLIVEQVFADPGHRQPDDQLHLPA
jgi:peptide/nickel transport system permease protein